MTFYGSDIEFGSEFNSVYGTEQTVDYLCACIHFFFLIWKWQYNIVEKAMKTL